MCSATDILCRTKEGASKAAADVVGSSMDQALHDLAKQAAEAWGQLMESMAASWVKVSVPQVGGTDAATVTEPPAGALSPVMQVLGYASWIALAVAVLSLIAVGARMASNTRDGAPVLGRLGWVMFAAVMVAAAGPVTNALLTQGPSATGTAGFLQGSLWWVVGALVVVSVIVASVRMAWEQRGDGGRDLLRSLITLLVVSTAGAVVVNLLIRAGDIYSVWILSKGASCDASEEACVKRGFSVLINASVGGVGILLVLALSTLGMVTSLCQIALMIVRSGLLVVMTGTLPVAAAATNTATGRNMFNRYVGWMMAFIFYKPVAATIYAAAVKMMNSADKPGWSDLSTMIAGICLMVLAVFALPALMKFLVPVVASMTGSGSGAGEVATIAAAAAPTGAMMLMGRGQSQPSSPSPSTSTSTNDSSVTGAGPSPSKGDPAGPPVPGPTGNSRDGNDGNTGGSGRDGNSGSAGDDGPAGNTGSSGTDSLSRGGTTSTATAAGSGTASAAGGPPAVAANLAGDLAAEIPRSFERGANDATGQPDKEGGPDGSL